MQKEWLRMRATLITLSRLTIPVPYAVVVFALLLLLLVQREVRSALGKSGSRRWRIASDSLIGVLVLAYGIMLISRFLNLLY